MDLENSVQIFELKAKLWQSKQGEREVTEYFNVMKGVWQELDLCYEEEWDCPRRGWRMIEAGLNKNLGEVRGRIVGRKPLPSLSEVFAKVRREEGQREVMMGENNQSLPKVSALVLKANSFTHSGHPRQNKRNEKVWCEHFNKPWHTKETS